MNVTDRRCALCFSLLLMILLISAPHLPATGQRDFDQLAAKELVFAFEAFEFVRAGGFVIH